MIEKIDNSNDSLLQLLPLAIRSHNGTSFSPERRGEYAIQKYSAEMDSDIAEIREAAAKNEEIDELTINAAVERYKANYSRYLSNYFSSHANVISPMITGPARFPVARNRKRIDWADNHFNHFRTWRERALKAIKKSFTQPVDPLEAARKNLARREATAKQYVEINKAIRKYKGVQAEQVEALKQVGLTEPQAIALLTPDFIGRIGIPQYRMTNNNQNIQRLKKRVAELESKAQQHGSKNKMFGTVELIKNLDQDRLQLKFPGKPVQETITKLKKCGFKWSPPNQCWQRQLTSNALWSAQAVLGGNTEDYQF